MSSLVMSLFSRRLAPRHVSASTRVFASQQLPRRQFSSSCEDNKAKQEAAVKQYLKDVYNTDAGLQDVLAGNKQWAKETDERDPAFFPKIGAGQSPSYLYIGCADARVDPIIMTGLEYGDMFVHRNVGNIVSPTDLNLMTVLEYAVEHLHVPHIVVCGHYECGAVRASSEQAHHGFIENWLTNIRDVQRIHHKELDAIKDPEDRHKKLVELNVVEQSINLLKVGCVQRKRAEALSDPEKKFALPLIHSLVFDPHSGLLKRIDVDWEDATKDFEHLYNLYPKTKTL